MKKQNISLTDVCSAFKFRHKWQKCVGAGGDIYHSKQMIILFVLFLF